jgi:trigger factor
MVTLDTEEIDNDGNLVEGRAQKDMKLFIGSEYISKDYYDAIKGIKEGEEKTFDTVNENKEPVKVKIKCTKVEKVIYPEMNEATFLKMTGKEEIKTEEELKTFLKEEISKSYNEHSYNSLKNKVVSEVVKLNDIEIPETYVNELLNDYFESHKKEHKGHNHEINEEDFKNKNRAEVSFTGKWFLIKDKIIQEEKIEVTDDDIKAFADEAGKPYGIPGDKMYEFYKDNKEVRHNVLDKKVVDFLIDNAKVTEIEEVKKSIKLLAEEKKNKKEKE